MFSTAKITSQTICTLTKRCWVPSMFLKCEYYITETPIWIFFCYTPVIFICTHDKWKNKWRMRSWKEDGSGQYMHCGRHEFTPKKPINLMKVDLYKMAWCDPLSIIRKLFGPYSPPFDALCPFLSWVAQVTIFSLNRSKSKTLSVKKTKYKWQATNVLPIPKR